MKYDNGISRTSATIVAALIIGAVFSQNDSTKARDEHLLGPIEIHPSFPGGENELQCFIDRNLNKDLLAKIDVTGTIWAQITVDTLGNISDVVIIKSLNGVIDQEFKRLIELMPRWEPGTINGRPYSTEFNIALRMPYKNNCR